MGALRTSLGDFVGLAMDTHGLGFRAEGVHTHHFGTLASLFCQPKPRFTRKEHPVSSWGFGVQLSARLLSNLLMITATASLMLPEV